MTPVTKAQIYPIVAMVLSGIALVASLAVVVIVVTQPPRTSQTTETKLSDLGTSITTLDTKTSDLSKAQQELDLRLLGVEEDSSGFATHTDLEASIEGTHTELRELVDLGGARVEYLAYLIADLYSDMNFHNSQLGKQLSRYRLDYDDATQYQLRTIEEASECAARRIAKVVQNEDSQFIEELATLRTQMYWRSFSIGVYASFDAFESHRDSLCLGS